MKHLHLATSALVFLAISGGVPPVFAQITSGGKPVRFLWTSRHAPVVSPKPSNLADTSTYSKTDTIRNSWLAEYVPSGTKNGAAVIAIPGGGYSTLSPWSSEAVPAATNLNSYGVTVFILHYRITPYGYPHPMWDVQRAVRWVRANAAAYGIDPNRIGVLGYSAGGHVASTAATHFDNGLIDSNAANGPYWFPGVKDSIDRVSSRPNFQGLMYPMITMVQYVPGTTNTVYAYASGRTIYIGNNPSQSLVDYTSNEKQVTPQTPPAFLNWGTADNTVNPLNSTAYRDTLISRGISVKTVIVPGGGHSPSTARLDTLKTWLSQQGFLTPVAIRPGRAGLHTPARDLRPDETPDALGRFSDRPYGTVLKAIPEVQKP